MVRKGLAARCLLKGDLKPVQRRRVDEELENADDAEEGSGKLVLQDDEFIWHVQNSRFTCEAAVDIAASSPH